MLIPSALFVSLLVATAFIAHWSDNLGKKLGKKRVSVFGLRPRTSATLLTVASSWGIMLFTLAALLLTVAPLRNALFYYESDRAEAIKTVKILKDETQTAQHEKKQAQLDEQISLVKAQTADTQASNSQKQAQNAHRDYQSAKRSEHEAVVSQQKAATALTRAQNTLKTSQNQLTRTRGDLTRGRAQILRAQGDVARAQQDLTQANSDLTAKRNEVKAAEVRVKTAKAGEKSANDAKKKAEAITFPLSATNLALEKENRNLEAQRTQLNRDIAALKQEKEQAQNLTVATVDYSDKIAFLALQGIVLPVDQTLAERRFDATRDPGEVARQLRILIDAAKEATTNEEDGIFPKAEFVVGAVITDPTSGNQTNLNKEQAIPFFADALSSANRSVSARLVSAFNYPGGSPRVVARFVFIPISTLYIARENIAEAEIDATKSESAIFGELQNLVDSARHNAVKRGASPPLSPDEQNFFDGDTGPKIFNALREVQKIGHPVTVSVVAARDLDSAEPLQVRFVIGDQTA